MAYADHSEGGSRTVSIVIVAVLHAVLGYAFVTGLGYEYVKKAAEKLNVVDVKEEPPPPDEPPPPPPPDRAVPPPPVVTPKPMVSVPQTPVYTAPPPPVFVTPTAPPAPPPPPAPKVAASKASPRGAPGSWVTTDDYPARALREEREGTTGFRLSIGTDGRATNCDVTSSSGSPDLDAETCKNLLRRARFKPAVGTDGQPMTDSYSSRVVWRIPK